MFHYSSLDLRSQLFLWADFLISLYRFYINCSRWLIPVTIIPTRSTFAFDCSRCYILFFSFAYGRQTLTRKPWWGDELHYTRDCICRAGISRQRYLATNSCKPPKNLNEFSTFCLTFIKCSRLWFWLFKCGIQSPPTSYFKASALRICLCSVIQASE